MATTDETGETIEIVEEVAKVEKAENPIKNALIRAAGGGLAGAMAMGIQVFSLMWLRTTMNYQYRYGTTTTVALKTLYKEGGIPRFYRGLLPALAQGPLSRFGDTAANEGVKTYLNSNEMTKDLPVFIKTACASVTSASWRATLMPIDAIKTILQVEGKPGFNILMQKIKTSGPSVLYHGTAATFAASLIGHFPWFFTYNYLDEHLPKKNEILHKLGRSALMGFAASIVSDTCSNSMRVIKTTKQTSKEVITYYQAVRLVVDKDGWFGLFGRGLKTRIITNGLQGLLFSVMWRLFDEHLFGAKK